jgi:glutathione synthase/RimK-type ligase-like ATP-grasp enzyme
VLLIVTNKGDAHSDVVIRDLASRKLPVFRLNTEDLLEKYRVTLEVDGVGGWSGKIIDELNRSVDFAQLRIAWIRRPEFRFHSPLDGVQEYISSETRALIHCIYSLPQVRFVNEVFDSSRAKTKFQQLVHTSRYGILVPRTIITNCPKEARNFLDAAKGDLLVKGIATGNFEKNGIPQALPSKRLGRDDLEALSDLVKNCPTQIQDYIEKQFELRITVIDDKVFAIKIESQLHELTKTDWRPHTALNPHSVYDLPSNISDFCVNFVKSQRLIYGAFDFIVDLDGRYYFLENNPSGQYLWLEHETGVPITAALVDFFASNM